MIQEKKKLSYLLLILLVLDILIARLSYLDVNKKSQSQVVNQKSGIDEQQVILSAGAAPVLENINVEYGKTFLKKYAQKQNYYNDKIILKKLSTIERIKEKHKNIYTDIIDNLTNEEKELICRITYREAGNQCKAGQRAVMEVILNRMADDNFDDSIEEVLSCPGEFSSWKLRYKVSSEDIEDMMEILDMVKNEEPVLADNYVYFSTTQHSYGKNYIKIQSHWFGTE